MDTFVMRVVQKTYNYMKRIFDKAVEVLMSIMGVETAKPPVKNVPMTNGTFVPNAVLFKLLDGSPCIIRRNADGWDLEHAYKMNVDHWPDISSKDPFEFVFINFNEDKVVTDMSKTIIPNHSCYSLYTSNLLIPMIEDDYQRRYTCSLQNNKLI